MREAAAIVAPACDLDRVTRETLKEHIALQDDERHADEHERKSIGFREAAARRRVKIGSLLIEAKRAIKHGGWLPYLEKLGIERQRAHEWMRLAEFVEEQTKCPTSPNTGHISTSAPTLADAGIDRRPRKRDVAPVLIDEQPDPPASVIVEDVDDARAVEASLLAMVSNSLGTVARRWPGDIKRLADELRRFADKIERKARD